MLVSLCDNDFRAGLRAAAIYLTGAVGKTITKMDSDHIKFIVIQHILAEHSYPLWKELDRFEHIKQYLQKIEVIYYQDRPTIDHDGGSLVIDLNLGNYYLI